MNRLLASLVLVVGLAAPAVLASKMEGSHHGVLKVEDRAGAFTPEGIKKAEDAFHATAFKAPTHFTVATVNDSHVPASLKSDFEAAKKDPQLAGRVFSDWARELAGRSDPGVFALVYVQDKQYYVRVLSSEKTDVHRHFTQDDSRHLSEILQAGLKEARDQSGDQAKATRSEALVRAAGYVSDQLKDTSVPASGGTHSQGGAGDRSGNGGGFFSGIGGLCCLAIVGLLGIWLIVGLIRAFSGGGGGGGYGPGGGGGFGGFFPSLLGGLFGAAAGMYLYDSFFGGSTASAADAAGADPGAAGDTGPDTYDGGADAGGGDLGGGGGDAGGGDFGGGDFGGGGGDFGGGDW